jgi:hypothetical protein
MVITTSDNLRALFENLKSLGFFGRLFGWNRILQINSAAINEFKTLNNELFFVYEQNSKIKNQLDLVSQDLDNQKSLLSDMNNKHGTLQEFFTKVSQDLKDREVEIGSFRASEQQKQVQYEHNIVELNSLKKQLDNDRIRIQEEREEEIRSHFEGMRSTWKDHENRVEEIIREICLRHQVEYVDKEHYPFSLKPDNAIKIAGEYIIFDAKSPSSDDLENFPTYIKNSTEKLKKYVKEDGVNKSLFLVIPTNTIDIIENYYYPVGEYRVFIVSVDTLEPIILSLKKIGEYEFGEQLIGEQLSPEERENICQIIGKFAHATKRRIQIDSYFCSEFSNILDDCLKLPCDIYEKTVEFEKSDKMNPPREDRAKIISKPQLEKDIKRIKQEIAGQDIDVTVIKPVMDYLPLNKKEE